MSFVITDLFIGLHGLAIFTWGSLIVIGLLPNYFSSSVLSRVSGSLVGAFLFFLITNFGVWTKGTYGFDFNGLIMCYTLAIPFFAYNLISTFIFSGIFEGIYKYKVIKKIKFN